MGQEKNIQLSIQLHGCILMARGSYLEKYFCQGLNNGITTLSQLFDANIPTLLLLFKILSLNHQTNFRLHTAFCEVKLSIVLEWKGVCCVRFILRRGNGMSKL